MHFSAATAKVYDPSRITQKKTCHDTTDRMYKYFSEEENFDFAVRNGFINLGRKGYKVAPPRDVANILLMSPKPGAREIGVRYFKKIDRSHPLYNDIAHLLGPEGIVEDYDKDFGKHLNSFRNNEAVKDLAKKMAATQRRNRTAVQPVVENGGTPRHVQPVTPIRSQTNMVAVTPTVPTNESTAIVAQGEPPAAVVAQGEPPAALVARVEPPRDDGMQSLMAQLASATLTTSHSVNELTHQVSAGFAQQQNYTDQRFGYVDRRVDSTNQIVNATGRWVSQLQSHSNAQDRTIAQLQGQVNLLSAERNHRVAADPGNNPNYVGIVRGNLFSERPRQEMFVFEDVTVEVNENKKWVDKASCQLTLFKIRGYGNPNPSVKVICHHETGGTLFETSISALMQHRSTELALASAEDGQPENRRLTFKDQDDSLLFLTKYQILKGKN